MKRLLIFAFLGLYACGPLDDAAGDGIGTDGGCSDTWSSYGSSFFSTSCAGGCHVSENYSSQSNVKAAKSQISSVISSGQMPKSGSISSSSKSRILTYLSCGVP